MSHPAQVKIPATYIRGGTSKGVFFRLQDLPLAAQEPGPARDALLMRVIGSPDPYGKQTDGMGGATSSTSKTVILAKSTRPDHDVDYLFGTDRLADPVDGHSPVVFTHSVLQMGQFTWADRLRHHLFLQQIVADVNCDQVQNLAIANQRGRIIHDDHGRAVFQIVGCFHLFRKDGRSGVANHCAPTQNAQPNTHRGGPHAGTCTDQQSR